GVAARLRGTGAGRGVVSRLGGDELGIMLPMADVTLARVVAGRLISAMRRPIRVVGPRVSIDAQVGVDLSGPEHADPESLLRGADRAMYAAKRAGRGRFVVVASTSV